MDKQLKINSDTADAARSQLRQEYETQQALMRVQPTIVQRFLETQARPLAGAVLQKLPQVQFKLPDRVVCDLESAEKAKPLPVPTEFREQMAGGLVGRLMRTDLRAALHQRLVELEESPDKAIAVSAGLIRYTTVAHMVHGMLPAGRSVSYVTAQGEEIPSIPVRDELLVNSVQEAEAHIASMQRFLDVLHAAVRLAPYIIADDEYQQKRYGMLGQLVNQGRALARYETGEIIRTINRRADAQDLNRGLSLSLPFFDDQDLEMKVHDIEVIPAGRIMFVPAFVVRAARMEEAKVAQDTRLSPSTRKHLLAELKMLEQAFDSSSGSEQALGKI